MLTSAFLGPLHRIFNDSNAFVKLLLDQAPRSAGRVLVLRMAGGDVRQDG